MKRVSFYTVGCKLNQYETELLASQMQKLGFERVDWAQEADLYIINSCNVTHKAAADSRRKIFSARRNAPDSKIIITGCSADIQGDELANIAELDLIVSNEEKQQLISKISGLFPEISADLYLDKGNYLEELPKHSRALIKIQNGCDQHCSYCIIPQARGHEITRPAPEIIREIAAVCANGYKEAILTGVHIGRYDNGGLKLSGLINTILDSTPIERIRLSSLEVNEIDDVLIEIAERDSRVCPHFHIPLQSGSDTILRSMNRPYKCKDYSQTIEKLKSRIPHVMVGADVIVGFPGEDDKYYSETMAFIENNPIDYLHVFSYSDHPKAKSYHFENKVVSKEIKYRNKMLTKLGNLKWHSFMKSQMTRSLPVLFEKRFTKNGSCLTGLSDNYIRVECRGGQEYFNTIQKVKPQEILDSKINAEIISI